MNAIAAENIQLLLVDDHAMFRDGLARLLETEEGFSVAAQCGSSSDALALLGNTHIDIVLLDVDLGRERALDFVVEARRLGFEGHVLVVTAGISGQEAIQLIHSGVAGILHKHNSGEALCDAIRKVAVGGVCLENEYLTSLFHSFDRSRNPGKPTLTEREKQMLRSIFQGLTNKQIAVPLNLSEGAVKASLHVLFDKLGVRTRAQLVKVALEQYRDQL